MLAAIIQDTVRAGSDRTDRFQVVRHYEHYGIQISLRSLLPEARGSFLCKLSLYKPDFAHTLANIAPNL